METRLLRMMDRLRRALARLAAWQRCRRRQIDASVIVKETLAASLS